MPDNKIDISVLIPTLNEENNIKECIESVRWADEIFVVDSYSTDKTVEIAENLGATVKKHEFEDYASQKNWALGKLKHDWVLWLDADERALEGVKDKITEILKEGPGYPAYSVRRINYFRDYKIKHGSWANERVMRFFNKNKAHFEKPIHEKLAYNGREGKINAGIKHFTFRSFKQYLPKLESHARKGAQRLFEQEKKAGYTEIFGRPLHYFLKNYILKRGFLDGLPGLVLALTGTYSVFLKYALLWELNQE